MTDKHELVRILAELYMHISAIQKALDISLNEIVKAIEEMKNETD